MKQSAPAPSVTGEPSEAFATLEAAVQFERLLADVSARFVNLPADQVDREIEAAQRLVCEALDIDRSVLFQLQDGEPGGFVATHVHQTPAEPAVVRDADRGRMTTSEWVFEKEGPVPAVVGGDARAFFPYLLARLRRGETLVIPRLADLPHEADRDRELLRRFGVAANLTFPLSAGAEVIGALAFGMLQRERDWPDVLVARLRLVAQVFANALARKRADEALQHALQEVQRLRDQLHHENVYLQQEARKGLGQGRIIGHSAAIRRILEQAAQVAPTPSTVLLLGETGTGKERVAAYIHDLSPRRDRPMVRVNCSAIPTTLIESELFGREKGAYTGALSRQIGRFELAHRSTIFLDEIGDLPPEVQAKLLRVLQERQIERLGSPTPVPVDIRIIAATHRNLEQAVHDGAFREDLYFRLAVFPIVLPPLRERREDVAPLAEALVEELAAAMGKRIEAISRQSLDALARYDWPGNVRELRNTIERALIVSSGPVLQIDAPGRGSGAGAASPARPLRAPREGPDERERLLQVLRDTGWRIRGPRGAAEILGVKPTTLETRLAKLGIQRPGRTPPSP